ncbi:MAG: hypothetical protein CL609_15060 [Anaerolineaceae bacterium]|nr:hypothetical protein [Anaerolineaceae bacterium]
MSIKINQELELMLFLANREAQACGAETIELEHLFLAILRILDGAINLEQESYYQYRHSVEKLNQYAGAGSKYLTMTDREITKYRRTLVKKLYINEVQESITLPSSAEVENLITDLPPNEKTLLGILGKIDLVTIKDKLEFETKKSKTAKKLISSSLSPKNTDHSQINEIGIDLTLLAKENKLPPFFGREDEINQLIQILIRTTKRNAILVGPAGVGKTAIIEGLAGKIVSPDCPYYMKDWKIIQINISSIIAGTSYRGVMEERLNKIIKVAQSDPNIILFFDEIHLMVNSGSVGDSSLDIANIMKPVLSRGEVRVIGATTQTEYERYLKKDNAFQRRFMKININEPGKENAIAICKAWAIKEKEKLQVEFTQMAVEKAVEWSIQYIPSRYLPDKAIDLLDTTAANKKFKCQSIYQIIDDGNKLVINENDIWDVLQETVGIELDFSQLFDPNKIEIALKRNIVGQEKLIQQLSETFEEISLEINRKSSRPIASFLFYGANATGKTTVAQIIASALYPESPISLMTIQLEHLKNSYDISHIIGAAPGLIGHEKQGVLFEFIETYSQGVIVLDNLDRAHPEIQSYLLNIIKDGRATDNHGRKAHFGNYLFIITVRDHTNLTDDPYLKLFKKETDSPKLIENIINNNFELSNIVNAVDFVFHFQPLPKEKMKELHELYLNKSKEDLVNRFNVELSFIDDDLIFMFDYLWGSSRDITEFHRRYDKYISKPIIKHLTHNKYSTKINIGWKDNRINIIDIE